LEEAKEGLRNEEYAVKFQRILLPIDLPSFYSSSSSTGHPPRSPTDVKSIRRTASGK